MQRIGFVSNAAVTRTAEVQRFLDDSPWAEPEYSVVAVLNGAPYVQQARSRAAAFAIARGLVDPAPPAFSQ